MAFEIIVKQTGTEPKLIGGEWVTLDETFMTKKDIDNLSWIDKDKIDQANLSTLKKKVLGYAPQVEKIVPFEKEVYRQVVDDVDLIAVVKAVNKVI